MMSNKKVLRDQMLARRLSLSKEEVKAASLKIAEMFMDKWGGYKSYLLYSPVRNEVDTAILAEMLWKAGKTVLYPKVEGESLVLGGCNSIDDLRTGYGGVPEPCHTTDCRVQAMLAPGLAFDRRNYRLGYGKGYYDRFLAKAQIELCVGVAYKWQVVESVFPEEHDIPVDTVLTD